MRFSKRRRIAGSRLQEGIVAPRTRMPSCVLPTPCIWTRNSCLDTPRAVVLPLTARTAKRVYFIDENNSFCSRAISKRLRTSLSLSPCHFDTRSEDETEKKTESASVATALARYDFPVPGDRTAECLSTGDACL